MNLVTLDFETYYDREYSLSKMTMEAYLRDPRFEVIGVSVKLNDDDPVWVTEPDEVADTLNALPLRDSMLLAHNTAFDASILAWHYGIRPKFHLDTMSMAKPLHGMGIGVSLRALSDYYTIGVKGNEVVAAMGKHRADFSPEELASYGIYCKKDVQLTYMLFEILKANFPVSELRVIDLLLRMYTTPVLEFDEAMLEKHLGAVLEKKEEVLATVERIAGKDALMSNPKFANVLKSLGVDPPMKVSAATGKPTYAFSKTDQAFKELLDHENPNVQAVVAARFGVKSTLEETRTAAFLKIAERGPIPVLLNYYGGHTGRASGGDGVNFQNLPRGGVLRKAIVAPEGYEIVACDSSQIEARVVAWLAGQTDLVEAFRRGDDIYSSFATTVYGYPVDRKKKEMGPDGTEYKPFEKQGFVGKTGILGLGFGTGAAKLQHTLKVGQGGISLDLELTECERIVRLYREKYFMIPQLWDFATRALYAIMRGETYKFGRCGLLSTTPEGILLPNGMQVRYPNLGIYEAEGWKQFAYTSSRKEVAAWTAMRLSGDADINKLTRIYGAKVVENVVQALARIVVFDQMLEISKKYRVVLTVHDEVVICVRKGEAEEAGHFMEATMSKPTVWAPDLPVSCEWGYGPSYGTAK